jgi:putative ABC transport system ATP-binding protein
MGRAEGKIAVRCRGLTKAYGSGDARVDALRGADLDVVQGEILMLVGPSGSGKTTLLSIMTAILEQDEGECLVFGRDLRQQSVDERARLRGKTMGFVFQTFNLLPALTALENVSVPLLINGASRDEAEERAMKELELVGLRDRSGALPGQLSGGQQQRVAIARALVHDPRLVACDEPTSNLDAATGRDIMRALSAVATGADRAVVVVTHDLRISDQATRIARMEDGRVVEVLDGGSAGRPA